MINKSRTDEIGDAGDLRGDLLNDRWIVRLSTLCAGAGGLEEREIGDDALFGYTLGGIGTNKGRKDHVRHTDNRACL